MVAILLATVSGFAGCRDPQPVAKNPSQSIETAKAESGNRGRNVASASGQTSTVISFEEVTAATGVHFVNRNGEETGLFAIVESLGGGVGVIDIDRDGRDDMLLPGGGEMPADLMPVGLPCGLFRNGGDWQFADVSSVAGVAAPKFYSHGVACGDYDNDGFPDAVVTGYGGMQFFHNLGDGTFEEISVVTGLTDRLWSSSAAWGDISGDSLLDLYVCHYVDWGPDNNPFCEGPEESKCEVCPPRDFQGLSDSLYVTQTDGMFYDASTDFNLRPLGKGLGVVIADLDDDRDLDIYVANDTVPNVLYVNDGGKTLTDRSFSSGATLNAQGVPQGSMGVQIMDFDRNGQFDLWVTNYERETSALYAGQGQMLFRHRSQRVGVTAVGARFVGWGTLCFDADHDGDEDVFVANGHVIRYPAAAPLRQVPLLFENWHDGRFRDVAATAGDYMSDPHMGRGCAAADFDGDGDLDIAVMHTNEPLALLKNQGAQFASLAIDLVGRESSRDAVGAVVEVVTARLRIVRQLTGGGSYASTSSRRLHFGLGDAEVIEELNVKWPSGNVQQFQSVAPNSQLTIIEGRGAID